MTRLVFTGKSKLRRDPRYVLAQLRARFPNVSEQGIQEIALRRLEVDAPRHNRFVHCFFGADIMTADPTTIPAWPHLTSMLRGFITQRAPSGRHTLIDPKGLSRTYVWSQDTAWTQEVNDADVEVIRRSAAADWFREADEIGDWRPQRVYDFPVIERETFLSLDDARAYEREQQSRIQRWQGR